MFIRHNISALNTTRQFGIANKVSQKSTERLSTSLQLNRAGDDVAGLSITEKMRGQIAGLNKAVKNTQDSISLVQTAESALSEVNSILIRGRELAVQSASDTNTDDDRQKLQQEMDQLLQEIDRIGTDTEFNTKKLFSEDNDSFVFHLGANASQNIKVGFEGISSDRLEISDLSISTQGDADQAISALDNASSFVSDQRTSLGALQNRLEHTIFNNDQTEGNLASAESLIRDANIASEVMDLTKSEILQDTMQSTMSHSNIQNDWVLNLLK